MIQAASPRSSMIYQQGSSTYVSYRPDERPKSYAS